MPSAHKWEPIADLPGDLRDLTDGELASLLRVWNRQREQLIECAALAEFDRRLRREWSIETGIIEGAYTLDRGITKTLIERGIDADLISRDSTDKDPLLVARIIQDHYDALEGMFDFVAGRRPLSTSYVKELHAALLRTVDTYTVRDQFGQLFEKRLEKGLYKESPNSPTRPDGSLHEYSPPEHVASEMDELIRMHLEHEARNVPPEVSAAWLHHRFTQIHPFGDGNGRVARSLASLVFIRAGWLPLVVKRDDRARYIDALESADAHDLRPLAAFFVDVQRDLVVAASEVGYEDRPIASTHEAVLAVKDRLIHRGKLARAEWNAAKETASQLVSVALNRLEEVAAELGVEIGALDRSFSFIAGHGDNRSVVKNLAILKSGHVAPTDFSDRAFLALNAGAPAELSLSFDAIGPPFRGLIRVRPYLAVIVGSAEIDAGTFLINYEEEIASATSRFSTWLDRVIVQGLNMWRLTL
jgi:Fic family protein